MVIPTFDEWLDTVVKVDCGFSFTNKDFIPPGQRDTAEYVYNSVIAMLQQPKD